MAKKQEYYKVVSVVNNKLYSIMIDALGALALQYYVHRPVTAKVGGILVFTDKDAAQSFVGSAVGDVSYAVYRCTVRDEVSLPQYGVRPWRLTTEKLRQFWETGTLEFFGSELGVWPLHTKAFRTITLRERIR